MAGRMWKVRFSLARNFSGKGEYEVDGEKFAVGEGSVVRVAPAGVRALRNTSDAEMVMMCIQYEAKPITSFMDDANIIK